MLPTEVDSKYTSNRLVPRGMGDNKHSRSVLITGCSEGGLGSALARAFANEGFYVLATVRDPAKASRLVGDHFEILKLEVTSQKSIDLCAAEVKERLRGKGLDVLINNAGTGLIMPLLDTSVEESRRLFDVNVWGMLAVTQAFAPLVIQAKGTVVNISSLAGAVQMAWQGTYAPDSYRSGLEIISNMVLCIRRVQQL